MKPYTSIKLVVTLTSLCTLGTVTARPADAQNLLYTLNTVTFDDGATATGSFTFDPTTKAFGPFDMTTTNGVTDTLKGVQYLPGLSKSLPGATLPGAATPDTIFTFTSTKAQTLVLETILTSATTPGVYALRPGRFAPAGTISPGSPPQILNSGELIPIGSGFSGRGIIAGSLNVSPAAVPEASTVVSLGLMLILGLGGIVVAAKRKKTATDAA